MPPSSPEPADVLRWCAAAAPEPWFPSAHAAAHNIPRDALDEPVWRLCRSGLIRVTDWVRGRGQGFALTPDGEAAVAGPPDPAPPSEPVPTPPPGPTPSHALPLEFAPGPAAMGLATVCVVWFLVGAVVAWRTGVPVGTYLYGRGDGVVDVLLRIGAVPGDALLAGQGWRLVSCGFGHYGLAHLVGNILVLATAGSVAERCWGGRRFLAVYFVSGLAGSCAAMAVHPNGVLAGASGSVWGVMTAVVAWFVLNRNRVPPPVYAVWRRRLVVLIVGNAVVSAVPGVSWPAHLGGGLAGFALAVALDFARPGRGWKRVAGVAAAVVVAIAGPIGLAAATTRTPQWRALRTVVRHGPPRVHVEPGPDQVLTFAKGELRAAHEQATLALFAGTPTAIAAARERVARDRAAVERATLAATGTTPGALQFRTFLRASADFLTALDAALAAGRVPTVGESKALGAKRRAAEAAWPTASPSDPPK